MMRSVLAVALVVVAAACGGGGGGDDAVGASIDSPCDLADAAMVQATFGGTVADGVEGQGRNCEFTISDGPVESVSVFHFGDASGFAGTRSGFEENRGGTTDVAGIGDEAFYPNDRGPSELVVSSGGQIFEVSVFVFLAELPPGTEDMVAELAHAIDTRLGG
jgi:hypothetical protein